MKADPFHIDYLGFWFGFLILPCFFKFGLFFTVDVETKLREKVLFSDRLPCPPEKHED